MTLPVPKVTLESPSAAYLLPFAKKELARFRETSDFGHKRYELPTGESITLNWSQGGAHIRIGGGIPTYIFANDFSEMGFSERIGLMDDLETWYPLVSYMGYEYPSPSTNPLRPDLVDLVYPIVSQRWGWMISDELQFDNGQDYTGGDIDAAVNDVSAVSQMMPIEDVFTNSALFGVGEEPYGRMLGMSPTFNVVRTVAGVETTFTQCLVGYMVRKVKPVTYFTDTPGAGSIAYDRLSRIVIGLYEFTPDTPSTVGPWTEVQSWEFSMPYPESDFLPGTNRYKWSRVDIPPTFVLSFNDSVTAGVALLPVTISYGLWRGDAPVTLHGAGGAPPTEVRIYGPWSGSYLRWYEQKMTRMGVSVTRDSNGGVSDVIAEFDNQPMVAVQQLESGQKPVRSVAIFPYTGWTGWRLGNTYYSQVRIYT